MKPARAIAIALLMALASPPGFGFAQNRAALTATNNQYIFPNGQNLVTAADVNYVIAQVIAATGNLTDANPFAAGSLGLAAPNGCLTVTSGIIGSTGTACGGSSSSGIVVGTTTVAGGTPGRLLFDSGGLVGELATTGSGNAVLAAGPTITGLIASGAALANPTVTGAFTATGLVTNADLANSATSVNGQTCALGGSCTVTTGLTIGTTAISGGASGRIEFNNAGVLGERAMTGTGTSVASSTGALTSGHCVSINGTGDFVDAGGACTTSGGGGTVASSTIGQIAVYTGATVVTGTATGANVVAAMASALNGSGAISATTSPAFVTPNLGTPSAVNLVNATAASLPLTAINATATGTGNLVLATSPTLVSPALGTPSAINLANATAASLPLAAINVATTGSGSLVLANSPALVSPALGTPASGVATNLTSIPMGNAAGTLAVAHGGTGAITLAAGMPIIANGTSALTTGTFSGTTTVVATANGTLTPTHCVQIDASGNFADAGGTCSVGGGGGTVLSGTAGQLAYYSGSGTTVTGYGVGANVLSTLSQPVNGASGMLALNASNQVPVVARLGDTTGATPCAGCIGQIISADVVSGSAVSLTTATGSSANITSVALSAGHWKCTGNVQSLVGTTSVNVFNLAAWISTLSNTEPVNYEQNGTLVEYPDAAYGGATPGGSVGEVYYNFTVGSTTVYLTAYAEWGASTFKVFGRLQCLRFA